MVSVKNVRRPNPSSPASRLLSVAGASTSSVVVRMSQACSIASGTLPAAYISPSSGACNFRTEAARSSTSSSRRASAAAASYSVQEKAPSRCFCSVQPLPDQYCSH